MWNGINRRKFPRANYGCFIYIKAKGAAKAISTQTENIGVGGICVVIEEDLGLFQGVELEITLDDGKGPVKCAGTVVWVVKKRPERKDENYKFDTGIEFVDLEDSQADRIVKIVDLILKKESSTA